MAQVVQQRTPPYLLIVFGFISLIAIVLAVMFYMQAEEATKLAKQREQDISVLADPQDRSGSLVEQAQQSDKTVVEILRERIGTLARMVDVSSNESYTAATSSYNSFAEANPELTQLGLIRVIGKLQDELAAAPEDKQNAVQPLQGQITDLETNLQTARNELQAEEQVVQQLRQQLATVEKQLEDREETLQAQKRELEDDLRDRITERDTRIANLTQEVLDLGQEAKTLRGRNDAIAEDLKAKAREVVKLRSDLQAQLAGERREPQIVETPQEDMAVSTVDMATVPDGKILRVIDDEDLCYVNIGAKAGVRPYMPFSVYDAEGGVPTSGANKGTLLVTKVSESVSECRIITYDPKNPITVEDVVANVAFDTTGEFEFYVYGQFDLTGQGRPSDQGREEVKGIIRQSGGNVSDSLDVDTDFLVIGPRPPVPEEPREGQDLNAIAIYEDRMARLREYDETLAAAMKLGVQILNTNRFIAFTGYSPKMPQR
ncbi:MAG: hypothetical protein ACLFUJ_11790 [Phycisphaerae bacterium]